jgi:hypothetical protein
MQIVRLFNGIDFDSQGDARLDLIDGPDFPPIKGDRDVFEFPGFPITASRDFALTSDGTTSLEFAGGFIQGAITCGIDLFGENTLFC